MVTESAWLLKVGGSIRTATPSARQAHLESPAFSASGHERKVNGRSVASGEKKFDLSDGVARLVTY